MVSNLCECVFNKNYKIDSVNVDDKKLKIQLKNLGFENGEIVRVLRCNYGRSSFLVEVMDVTYALDKKICQLIFVKECDI